MVPAVPDGTKGQREKEAEERETAEKWELRSEIVRKRRETIFPNKEHSY